MKKRTGEYAYVSVDTLKTLEVQGLCEKIVDIQTGKETWKPVRCIEVKSEDMEQ